MFPVAKFNDIDNPSFISEINSSRKKILSMYIDAEQSLDNAFVLACYWGHYDIARWLLIVKPNITTNFNYLFQISCQHGYIVLAKFLLDKRPNEIDIMMYNNCAYRFAKKNYHEDICQWLISMNPDCANDVVN